MQPDQVGYEYKSPFLSSLLRYRGGQELFHHRRQLGGSELSLKALTV